MTEQDLLQLDFTRVDETAESSGAPNDWHYYTYDIANGIVTGKHIEFTE